MSVREREKEYVQQKERERESEFNLNKKKQLFKMLTTIQITNKMRVDNFEQRVELVKLVPHSNKTFHKIHLLWETQAREEKKRS